MDSMNQFSNITESDISLSFNETLPLNATLLLGTQALLLGHPAVHITDWAAFLILLAWSIILARRVASFKVDDALLMENYFFGYPSLDVIVSDHICIISH